MKSGLKSSAASNGVERRACLSASNNYCTCWSQTNGRLVWSRCNNPWDFIAYSGTKWWRKLALPWRLYSWRRFFGIGRSRIAWNLRGSTVIPLWDTMNPSRRLAGTQKSHFRGFKRILYLRHHKNTCCKSSICCAHFGDWAVRYSRWNNMMWIRSWKQYVIAC